MEGGLQNYAQGLRDAIGEGDLRGCTEEELGGLRRLMVGGVIPEAYRQFLLAVGRCGGRFMSAWSYERSTLEATQRRGHQLRREGDIRAHEDAFFFMSDAGEYFFYFRTAALEEDPPVYFVSTEQPAPELAGRSLTDFIDLQLRTAR